MVTPTPPPADGATHGPGAVTPPTRDGDTSPRRTDTPARPGDTKSEDRSTLVREAQKPANAPGRYVVQAGDTFTSIAREQLGDSKYVNRIQEANPGVVPEQLKEGQVINLPPKEGAAAPTASGDKKEPSGSGTSTTGPKKEDTKSDTGKTEPTASDSAKTKPAEVTYVVEAGDTLVYIARTKLGNAARWKEIYELNKDKIKDPNRLLEGQTLRLPPKEKKDAAKDSGKKEPAKDTAKKEPAKDTTKKEPAKDKKETDKNGGKK